MKERLKLKKFLDKFFSVIELNSIKGISIVLTAVCVIMLIALGYGFQKSREPKVISEYIGIRTQADEPTQPQEAEQCIFVHIKGEVKSPGLYQLKKDCRISDAVSAAGGFNDNAAIDRINLAQKLSDEAELYIPSKLDGANEPQSALSNSNNALPTGKQIRMVNINTASSSELETLPGIGQAYASRIIDFRLENGSYSRIEDIMKVKGISKGRFEALKAYIRV